MSSVRLYDKAPFCDLQGISENKEMHRLFVRCKRVQGKKRRNPLWISSIFNEAITTPCRKIGKFRLFRKPLNKKARFLLVRGKWAWKKRVTMVAMRFLFVYSLWGCVRLCARFGCVGISLYRLGVKCLKTKNRRVVSVWRKRFIVCGSLAPHNQTFCWGLICLTQLYEFPFCVCTVRASISLNIIAGGYLTGL